MVFELTDTLMNEAVVNDADRRRSLSNLFIGYEEGSLLLSASPELLDYLSENLKDSFSQRIINHLQHKVLAHFNVMWQTRVVLENPNVNNHEISIDFFRRSSSIQPPTVLCENLDDTKFYFSLCKEYFGEAYINTTNGRGAGGSSIADELEDIINKNDRFCLCIVDSDIKYPNAPVGGTFKSIINKHLVPSPTYAVCKLNVHEIENLIPIQEISPHIKDNGVRKFAGHLSRIDNQGDVLFYYDIKEGIKLSMIQGNPDYYSYASLIYHRLNPRTNQTAFNLYIQSLSSKNKECVFPPLCPGALGAFLRRNPQRKHRFVYCDYLRNEWGRVKEHIVTFLCCRQNEPIN